MKRAFDGMPIDADAEERAWAVVREAYRRRGPVALVAAAGIAAVVAAALSPPGQAVVNAVRRSIGIEGARPALFRLPAPGRLLVSGAGVERHRVERALHGRSPSTACCSRSSPRRRRELTVPRGRSSIRAISPGVYSSR